MIHGSRVSIGCFAMTNDSIEQIYSLVAAGLARGQKRVKSAHCFPFRMTAERMAKALKSKWYGCWSELQPGYIEFETTAPPADRGSEGAVCVEGRLALCSMGRPS